MGMVGSLFNVIISLKDEMMERNESVCCVRELKVKKIK